MIRGKTVMSRAKLKAELLDLNKEHDGPWEPAIFVDRTDIEAFNLKTLHSWYRLHESARIEHDPEGRHGIHLPGDDKPFDLNAVVAKLLIAEIVPADEEE